MSAGVSESAEQKICRPGGKGLWLPIYDGEQKGSDAMRAIVYGFLLLYFFQGASIVSDYFMSAIETITSRKKLALNEKTGRQVTVLVWNSTVSNLTLMALGSSAPEILLSVVEVFSREFYSGDLGPSTIVGSAAFNLLIIIAICICAIPAPQVRYIEDIDVFYVTAIFSAFAYFWLLLIVQVITPEIIDIWEGVLTLLFFPTLVYLSFLADRGKLPLCQSPRGEEDDDDNLSYVHENTPHPRARSIQVQRMELEHKAAIEHEYQQMKRGSLKQQRGSIIHNAKTIMLPAGEPYPVGDDGEVLKDMKGNVIECQAGIVTFTRDVQEVMAGPEETTARVIVLRRNGSEGQVMCRYHSELFTAIPGFDYREATGVLIFEDGKMMAEIEIVILPVRPKENDEKFQLVLTDIEGGAIFNPNDDGGKEACVCTIVIKNDGSNTREPTWFERACDADTMAFSVQLWREQVREAFTVSASDEEEDEPNVLDYIFHFISLPWKAFYAVTAPPPIYAGGWVLFFVALGHIALLTSAICDLATFFGCVLQIEDAMTAIIVVATGTSLPDLFASKSAALADEFADASIVNVTGSNSVNVFLGIGITWTISAIYWTAKGATDKWKLKYPEHALKHPNGGFIVKTGTLVYTVAVFNAITVMAVCTLRLKRKLFGGELGGPLFVKVGSAVILLSFWGTYIGLFLWKSSSDTADAMQWVMLVFAVLSIVGCIIVELLLKNGTIVPYLPCPDDPDFKKKLRQSEEEVAAQNQSLIKQGLIDAAAQEASNNMEKDLPEATPLGKMQQDESQRPASPTDDSEDDKEDLTTTDGDNIQVSSDGKPKRRFKKGITRETVSQQKSENSPKKKVVRKRSSNTKAEVLKGGEEAYGQPSARGQPDQATPGLDSSQEDVILVQDEAEGSPGAI